MQKHEDLKAARLLAKATQQEASVILGLSRKQYNLWETGKVPIPEGKYEAFLLAISKAQDDVDAYWASRPAEEKAKPLPEKAEVDAYLLALPYNDAEAYCADILARHKEIHRPPPVYDAKGYDEEGYDRNGFDVDGFGRDGYNKKGRDKDGYGKPEGLNKLRYNRQGYPYPFDIYTIEQAGNAAAGKVWSAREGGDIYSKTEKKCAEAREAAEDAEWRKLIKLEGKDFVPREYARLLCKMDLNFEDPKEEEAYWAKVKADKIAKNEDLYILRFQVEYKLPGFVEAQKRLDRLDEDLC